MPKHGKNFNAAKAKVEVRHYDLDEAIATIKDASFAKFDESVEVAVNLGVDPRHADQMVRASVVLPQPLSPTSPSVVPASISNVTLRTARRTPTTRRKIPRRTG